MPPELDGRRTPDDEVLAYEALAVRRITGAAARVVEALLAALYAAWSALRHTGALTPATGRILARTAILALRRARWTPMLPALRTLAREARQMGQGRALAALERPAPQVSAPAILPARPVPDPDAALRVALDEAVTLAGRLEMARRPAVLAVTGRARAGLARAQGAVRYAVHDHLNAGTADVATAAGLNLIWVAERGACLDCLAHAGWVVAPGALFPAVSYDPRAGTRVVAWPPLHPNCRCEVRTYAGPAGAPSRDRSRTDPAARLAAEARRSVVYQWSTHSSGAAARRAAAALLASGADLPASVEARARRLLRAGRR